jgi:hypothetical protein
VPDLSDLSDLSDVCVPPLPYDAAGVVTMWILGPGWRGNSVYIAGTAYHTASGGWTFDLINSTGGPKTLTEMSGMIDPTIALNRALQVAKDNRGQGTAQVEGLPRWVTESS